MTAKIFTAILSFALVAASPAPLPSPTASPSASPSPSPIVTPAASSPIVPQTNGRPAGAHMTLHCPTIGDAMFRSAEAIPGPPSPVPLSFAPPGGIDQPAPFVPVPLSIGAGSLVLRDGVLGAGFVAWQAQSASPPAHDCELNVDDGSGRFLTRYAVLAAQPVMISPDPPRADGEVGGMVLRHAGIRLLNF